MKIMIPLSFLIVTLIGSYAAEYGYATRTGNVIAEPSYKEHAEKNILLAEGDKLTVLSASEGSLIEVTESNGYYTSTLYNSPDDRLPVIVGPSTATLSSGVYSNGMWNDFYISYRIDKASDVAPVGDAIPAGDMTISVQYASSLDGVWKEVGTISHSSTNSGFIRAVIKQP